MQEDREGTYMVLDKRHLGEREICIKRRGGGEKMGNEGRGLEKGESAHAE